MNDFFIENPQLTLVASGQFAITLGLYRDGTQSSLHAQLSCALKANSN